MRCSSELADSDKWGGCSGLFFLSQLFLGNHRRGGSKFEEHGTSRAQKREGEHRCVHRHHCNSGQCQCQGVHDGQTRQHSSPISGCGIPTPSPSCPQLQAGLAVGAAWGAWAMTCPRLKSGDDRKEIGRFCVCVAHSPQSRYCLPRRTTRTRELEGAPRDHITYYTRLHTRLHAHNMHFTQAGSGSRHAALFQEGNLRASYNAWGGKRRRRGSERRVRGGSNGGGLCVLMTRPSFFSPSADGVILALGK